VADSGARQLISRLRHDVYAGELRQYQPNQSGRLTDELDEFNQYLCAWSGQELLGFVSITPPGHGRYSVDKYVARERLPFPVDAGLYEARVLTVLPSARGREVAALLMYAALRWVESRGGSRIMAIGRQEVLSLYRKAGLRGTDLVVSAGAVTYEVLHASVEELRARLDQFEAVLRRLERRTDWRLDVAFRVPAGCFHGGTFFHAIGERFDTLERRHRIINADVLDAWFPPSPRVVACLEAHLPWLMRTSPPTEGRGLMEVIAQVRGVGPEHVLPGAGSSDLIFRAFLHWLNRSSRVLLLDPTYGEYAHVLERVIGCRVDRLTLDPEADFVLSPDRLREALGRGYDLVVLVNPNSPTGQHTRREALEPILRAAPVTTRIWIDETYAEYVGADQSLERFAATSSNVIVCKSMSKVYALSGLRVAYLCAAPHQLESLRALTPPWVVGLPAQAAAVGALQDPSYYRSRYDETHQLRLVLHDQLAGLGWRVVPGCANFLLACLPVDGPGAQQVVEQCQAHGLFLRNAANMGPRLGHRSIRIAVKDRETNARMLSILREVLVGAPVASGLSLEPVA
jgi:histidinol-phosphate/aromatic aminotransferase/cobyric acid decarboxylase-like protein/GNAT superfamily N-acetyltransferase